MNKLLSNTWAVVAIIAIVVAALTSLAIAHLIDAKDLAKLLTAFLAGAATAWQRGSALSAFEADAVKVATDKVEEEKPKTAIPPVLPLLMLALCLVFLPAATCAQAKTVVRTANDRAAEICAVFYSTQRGISVDDALKAFCTGEQVLAPWIHLVLSAEKNGVNKDGLALCAAPPTQSVVDGGHD